MSDPQGDASSESIQSRLSRSVGSVWLNQTGDRPGSVSTVVNGDIVKCTIENADCEAPSSTRYRTESVVAVAKIMDRKVNAFIPRHDKKTGVTTETFVLEPPRIKR